jgi:hypothetical protein
MNNEKTSIPEITRTLLQRAQEQLGPERAEELRGELELMAAQLAKLRSTPVDFEDEP